MIDKACETWREVKQHCEELIRAAAYRLEEYHTDERHADRARGEIAAARSILALAEPRVVQPSGDYSKRTDKSGY
jgi:hypothetical protein